jgi:hypothetical protein
MRRIVGFALLLPALVITCGAQSQAPRCRTGGSSLIEHSDGVTVLRVSFTDISGKAPVSTSAHAFVPDSSDPVAGIAVSFAAIQDWDKRTDLLPFAWALARAGAASIVLDRAIQWGPLDDAANLASSVMSCASEWLMSHANLDRDRLATAGLYGWNDDCDWATSRCWTSHFGMGFGQTGPVEFHNTELMMTLKGQLWMAKAAQKQLRLSAIQPEWLTHVIDAEK